MLGFDEIVVGIGIKRLLGQVEWMETNCSFSFFFSCLNSEVLLSEAISRLDTRNSLFLKQVTERCSLPGSH